jgi:hemolysin III
LDVRNPQPGPTTPRLRGVTHQWAFVASIFTGTALVLSAPSSRARLAAAIYAVSVVALFASSALYHRVRWRSPAARRWMRRLDHSMIFVVIAGTYTPFALIALRGALAGALLIVVWAGAAAGVVLTLAWIDAPEWLIALLYVLLGWVGAIALPTLIATLGAGPAALVAAGGVLYTAGAVIYARKRPDPVSAVFGYHEVFHVLVIAAAALQYAAIAFFVLPGARG